MDLKLTVDGLEKERDFYFGKLRDIELICQEHESSEVAPILSKILDVLYATEVKHISSIHPYHKKVTHKLCAISLCNNSLASIHVIIAILLR